MAHNVTLSEFTQSSGKIVLLTAKHDNFYTPDEVEFADAGGGLRIKMGAKTAMVGGEDLFALREFLAEFDERRFVRPADPVEKKSFWTDGDLVAHRDGETDTVWARRDGEWSCVITDDDLLRPLGREGTFNDDSMEFYLTPSYVGVGWSVLRRANA